MKTSHCIVFSTFYKKNTTPLFIGGNCILWSSTYLGVHLLCGRYVKFDLMPVKRAFCSTCDSILTVIIRTIWLCCYYKNRTGNVFQGGCLSPVIFNLFVNMFIIKLKLLNICCHIDSVHCVPKKTITFLFFK